MAPKGTWDNGHGHAWMPWGYQARWKDLKHHVFKFISLILYSLHILRFKVSWSKKSWQFNGCILTINQCFACSSQVKLMFFGLFGIYTSCVNTVRIVQQKYAYMFLKLHEKGYTSVQVLLLNAGLQPNAGLHSFWHLLFFFSHLWWKKMLKCWKRWFWPANCVQCTS